MRIFYHCADFDAHFHLFRLISRLLGTRALTKTRRLSEILCTKVFEFSVEDCQRLAHNQQISPSISALETQDHSLAHPLYVPLVFPQADCRYGYVIQ